MIGPCGGVDPHQNETRTVQRGGAGNVEAPAPTTTKRTDRTLSGAARDERPQGGSACSGRRINNGKERNTEIEKDVASRDLERRSG
jgi:hypothetical protein